MTLILQVFYSVFSGVILSAAIPNELYLFGCPVLAFIGLIPFYICIRNYCTSFKRAFLLSFIQVLTTHLLSSFWLAFFKDFAIFTLGASALATACIGGFMGLFLYLPYSRKNYGKKTNYLIDFQISKPFYEHTSFRIIYFSFIYTLYEWVKSSGFIGYPWGTVSSAMFKFPVFMQLSAITGTYGITFLTVLFNCLFAESFILFFQEKIISNYGKNKNQSSRNLCFELFNTYKVFIFFFGLSMLYGYYEYTLERKPCKSLTTIMVQQNSDPWKQKSDTENILKSQRLTVDSIEKLEKENKKPDLVVWSEGSLMKTFPNALTYYKHNPEERPLFDFIKDIRTPLLTGGAYLKTITDPVTEEETRYYFNSALVFDEKANLRGFYGKLHLVPFAESIPGMNKPFVKNIMIKFLGFSACWTAGEQLHYFDIPCSYYNDEEYIPAIESSDISIPYIDVKNIKRPTVKISTPICFDDSFSDVMRPLFLNGSELFINITDDSWSLKKSSEIQHFVIASYRAIEYRTTLIRSANAGYSVVVIPSGKIISDQPLFEDSSTYCEVPIYGRTITTYARFGNWLPYLSIIILILTSLYMHSDFSTSDFIPSERKNKNKKKHSKKHSKKK